MISVIFVLVVGVLIAFSGMPTVRADGGVSAEQTAVISSAGYAGVDVHTTDSLYLCGCKNGTLSIEPEVAAGPGHVMEVEQGIGRIFFKQLSFNYQDFPMTKIFSDDASTCDGIGDTRVLFDPLSGTNGRWFAAAIHDKYSACPGSDQTFLQHFADIAVSPTNDPSTSLPGTPFPQNWADYHPVIGSTTRKDNNPTFDHPEIAVTSDKVSFTTNFPKMLVYNKNDLVNMVSNPVPQDLTNSIPSQCTGQPYPIHSIGYTTRQYMICQVNASFFLFWIDGTMPNTGTAGCCTVSGWTNLTRISLPHCCAVTNSGNTNGRFTAAAPVSQGNPGTPSGYIVFDQALSGVWYNNKLWFATTAGCPFSGYTRDCIQLVKANAYTPPSTASPSVVQNFPLNKSDTDFFLPTLSIDGQGDLALIFGYSSPTIYPSLGITGQTPNDPSGSLAPWKTLKTGAGYDGTDLGDRYSDFFGAATDPSDPTLVWIAGQYYPSVTCVTNQQGTVPCWASWVASMRVVALALSDPVSPVVNLGVPQATTIYVQALGSFSGMVNLSTTVCPNVCPGLPNGPTVSFSTTSLSLGIGGSGSSTVTISTTTATPQGNYQLIVAAATQYFTPGLTVYLSVVYFDFSMSISPATLPVHPAPDQAASANATQTLTLFANASYSASVTSSASGQPNWLQVTFTPSTATPSSAGTLVTVTFTVPAMKLYSDLTYTVTITSTGLGKTHYFTMTVIVYHDCTNTHGCSVAPSP